MVAQLRIIWFGIGDEQHMITNSPLEPMDGCWPTTKQLLNQHVGRHGFSPY